MQLYDINKFCCCLDDAEKMKSLEMKKTVSLISQSTIHPGNQDTTSVRGITGVASNLFVLIQLISFISDCIPDNL